jgi:hypothetical protein
MLIDSDTMIESSASVPTLGQIEATMTTISVANELQDACRPWLWHLRIDVQ